MDADYCGETVLSDENDPYWFCTSGWTIVVTLLIRQRTKQGVVDRTDRN